MYCPSCGKESTDERRFCSNCGTNLQIIKQAVTGLLPIQSQQVQLREDPEADRKRRKLKGAGFIVIGVGLLYMILMLIISEVVRDFSYSAGRVLENLAPLCLIFFIIGLIVMIYGRIMYKGVRMVAPNQPTSQPTFQEQPNRSALTTGEINPYQSYQYPPVSVTEHTTAQLKQPQQPQPPQPQSIRIKQ
jgi:hypothetical protein